MAEDMGIVNVIQGPQHGPSANRNCGAAHSKGELIVFIDDDCIPDTNLIAAYQDASQRNLDVGVFEGRISAHGELSSFADIAPVNETGGNLWSCNFAIRRNLFLKIDGFDERYPFAAMEDIDLHRRVKKYSQVLFVPEARVWHSFEQRIGWTVVKHHALSLLLYLHIHGLKATGKGPVFFIKSAGRMLIYGGIRQVKRRAAKHPRQQVFLVLVSLQLAIIAFLWRFHGYLAKKAFPPCCSGCRSIHLHLS